MLTVAEYLTKAIDLSGRTQRAIAAEVGYPKPNVISMMRQGQTKIPIGKIPLFAKALGVDPAHMLRIALAEYHPEVWEVIRSTIGDPLTRNEALLLGVYREAGGSGMEIPLEDDVLKRVREALKAGKAS